MAARWASMSGAFGICAILRYSWAARAQEGGEGFSNHTHIRLQFFFNVHSIVTMVGRRSAGLSRVKYAGGWKDNKVQKDVLLELVKQNQHTSHFSFDRVTEKNSNLKLNENTASIGFIYRHIGETINLFGQLLGVQSDVTNTTIGQVDTGQRYDVGVSRDLIERGYQMLQDLVKESSDEDWLKPVDTPFFGTVSRVRLFAHALFHTSNHAGQISLILAKGR